MNTGGLDGDKVVALLGLIMALALVSSGGTFRAMAGRKRLLYGAAWAVVFGIVAAAAAILVPQGTP